MKKIGYLCILFFFSLFVFTETPDWHPISTVFAGSDAPFRDRLASMKESATFEEFCNHLFIGVIDYSPDEMDGLGDLTGYGCEKRQHRLRPLTLEWENQYLEWIDGGLDTIGRLSVTQGSRDYYLKEVLTRYLQNETEKYDFRYHIAQLSPVIGSQMELRQVFLTFHPLRNIQDAEDFIARLRAVPEKVDQIIRRFEESQAKGILMNTQSIAASQWLMNELLQSGIHSEIYKRFAEAVDLMDGEREANRKALINEMAEALDNVAVPAFKRINAALIAAQRKPNKNLGAHSFSNGDLWYRYALKFHTSVERDPVELHEWGLKEVETLRSQIEAVRALRPAASLTPLGASIWDFLPEWFEPEYIPSYRPEIIPFYSDMYSSPNLEQSSKGIYYSTRVPPVENTIYFHEVVPGHHLERANQLNRGLPLAAHLPFITVFIEGWALYAESLVAERFPYPDRLLDCYTWQLIRAKRIVADTGINALGWTYNQTVDYMSGDGTMNRVMAQNEVNRYLTWPAQACSYYLGFKTIVSLREKAKNALGDTFDIRHFHSALLEYGQLPLDLLEEKIDQWIATSQP